MSFEPMTPRYKPARQKNEGVSASMVKLRTAPAKLWLTFRAPVLLELRWRYEMRFHVLLGSGEDRGRVRLKPDDAGATVLEKRPMRWDADFGRINLGIVPGLPDAKRESEPVKLLRVGEGWVEIVLPAWAHEVKRGRPRLVTGLGGEVAHG